MQRIPKLGGKWSRKWSKKLLFCQLLQVSAQLLKSLSVKKKKILLTYLFFAPREFSLKQKEEQIIETRDKPQCLVVQRLLSHLQYPDATKSSTKDLSLPPFNLKSSWH